MFARRRHPPTPSAAPVAASAGVGYEALRFLSAQNLPHTPTNFALAWRVKADRAGLTAMAVDAILMDGRAITAGDVERILKAEAERATKELFRDDPQQDALRHQTRRLAELTADAVMQSRDFGSDLSSELCHLTDNTGSVHQIVAAMVQRTRSVEAQLCAASREIENLREQVETSRDDAQRDALTGLLNRRGAMHELASRRPTAPGVVGMCDVDHFKSINDRFGHNVGDRVLKGVAASLSESLGVHVVARWGGEEFLIVLDDMEVKAAHGLLEQARRDLEARTFRLRGNGHAVGTVTVSIGLAELAERDSLAAIDAADRMLYAAKQAGRNRVAVHRPEELRRVSAPDLLQ